MLGAAALLLAGTAVLVVLLTRGGSTGTAPVHRATPAKAFRDSVGVNVHLAYGDTSYANAPLVERSLRELGIRHVRDGACAGCTQAIERMRALGRAGVRFTLIAGDPRNSTGTLTDNLAAIRTQLRGVTEAVEGPNEYDASGDPQWAAHLRTYQRALFTAVRRDPALRDLPVIGPSFVRPDSRAQAGDMQAWMTEGNMHPYPGDSPPGPNLDGELALAHRVSGTAKPVVVTETGYPDAGGGVRAAVSPQAAAAYIPRLLLTDFRRGIPRTFLYELLDEKPDPAGTEPEQHFGLVRADGTPKPAFTALRGLLAAIGDGAPGDPATLRYSLSGAQAQALLFADSAGTRSLVLWRDVPADASPEPVTVRVGEPVGETRVVRDGVSEKRVVAPHELSVRVAADPIVIRFSRP